LVFVVCGLISEMRDIHTKIRQHGGEVSHIVSAQARLTRMSPRLAFLLALSDLN
jgi:mannose/fructose/N-acetylgalactosamine-specific phosphotransferase system component IID